MKKPLRSGYTTGTCAAAAAKGAVQSLLTQDVTHGVDVTLPAGKKVHFSFCKNGYDQYGNFGYAAVIKDAGDDPDVTNGAEIGARASYDKCDSKGSVRITGGEGVGTVTKPGLAVEVGQPAINPIPLQMIRSSVAEVLGSDFTGGVVVEIIIPKGRELAEKTLNERLGIVGGLSVLGTTGIVRPISAEAWTATITTAMQVAEAGGNREIVLSTGRTSEAALQKTDRFAPEAFIMMGDYLEFSLIEAAKFTFTRLHLSGMWAKILKAALRIPQTHVRFGALEAQEAVVFIQDLCPELDVTYLEGSNTAREIYTRLTRHGGEKVVEAVCMAAREYQQDVSGLPVSLYLVHHNGEIVMEIH